jgi:hypothetical protein
MYVVETQRADFLFACPSAAESFAASERRKLSDLCPGMGPAPIDVVPMSSLHRFNPDCPLEAGPGQESCRRVRRHVHRWWAERDAWWAAA